MKHPAQSSEVRNGGTIKREPGDNKAAATGRLSDAEVYCAPPLLHRPRRGNAYVVISL